MRPIAACAAAVAILLAFPAIVLAQDGAATELRGTIVHGVEGTSLDPADVTVLLNVFEGVSGFDQRETAMRPDGSFSFTVNPIPERTYFVTVEYQGARYSESRSAAGVDEPITITVYDGTGDVSVLSVDSYTVIVTGSVPQEGFVEVLERAAVRNESQMTLVPDLSDGAAMLSFLRFALPANAYNLDVRSDIVGGQVLTVDRGFAVTTPVPPTGDEAHQFEFVYRVPYDEPALDLSRTLRFGAGSVRYVVPVDTGTASSATLEDLGATDLNGRLLRLLEGGPIAPGDNVSLRLDGLELPSALTGALERSGRWYVAYAAPSVIGAALIALLALRVARRPAAAAAGEGEDPREALLARAAALEQQHRQGRVSARAYARQHDALRSALIALELDAGPPAP